MEAEHLQGQMIMEEARDGCGDLQCGLRRVACISGRDAPL